MTALRFGCGLFCAFLLAASLAAQQPEDPFRDDPGPTLEPVTKPRLVPGFGSLKETPPEGPPVVPTTTRPLADVPMKLDHLTAWRAKRYKVTADVRRKWYEKGILYIATEQKVSGTIELLTIVRNDQIVFRDTWWSLAGEVRPYEVDVIYPHDSLLKAKRIAFDPRHRPVTTDLSRGRYVLAMPGDRRSGEWPTDTVTIPAVMRLVGLLPREPGVGYTFANYSPVPQVEIEENRDPIVCVGPQKLKILGAWVDCTKFAWGDMRLWVRNCDGALARFDRPGFFSMVLVSDNNFNNPCNPTTIPLVPTPAPVAPMPGVPQPPVEVAPSVRPAPPVRPAPMPAPAKPDDDPFGAGAPAPAPVPARPAPPAPAKPDDDPFGMP